MNRTLLSVAAIGLAVTSVLSCSDKTATGPDGIVAANAGTDAYRSVSTVSVSLQPTSVVVGDSASATAVLRDYRGRIVTGSVTWSTGSSSIATVSAAGRVRGVSAGTAAITATRGSKTGSATLTVTTSSSTATVATVTVSLATSTINPGQTTQGTAVTRDANNNILTGRAIVWQSSNTAVATESASGVSSGVAAGTSQITATSEGKAGAAMLTVQAVVVPPPPPPTGTNEPTGMTVLTERSFSALNENGWTNTGGSSYSIVADASAPRSPSSVGQVKFPAGFGSGNAPVVLEKAWSTTNKTLYVSFWVKFSSNWDGNDSGVNKIFHFWIGGSNRLVLNARGVGSGRLLTEVELQGIKAGGNYDAGTTALFTANLGPTGELVRNQWLHWEAVFVGNSSGVANGTVDWWADGVKVGHYSGLQFVAGAGLWEELEWSPTYGGFGAAVPADQYQWIDHLYISGKAN
jgi:hypothetical protein